MDKDEKQNSIEISYFWSYPTFGLTEGQVIKGQIKTEKQDWRAVDSPKKRTNKFVLSAFLLFTANKTNSLVHFLGESTARQTCFWFYLIDSQEFQTFQRLCMLQQCSVPFECCNCHLLQCLMQLLDSPSSLPASSPDAIFILYQYELCKIKISFYDFCPTFISM